MLTKKQYQLLVFIDQRLKDAGVSPSFDEMKDALGLRSKSGIHRLITALEERGFLRRLPHRARALEVLRMPDNAVPAPARNGPVPAKPETWPPPAKPETWPAPAKPETWNVIRPDFKPQPPPAASQEGAVQLPLIGRIAAGTPIEALRDHSRVMSIPANLIGSGQHYLLEVEGDSMVDAGIHDGDTAVIQRCNDAESGSIVVALVDNEEVTLKRLRRRGQSIALEPANPAYEIRICGPDQVQVQGRLVGLIRRY